MSDSDAAPSSDHDDDSSFEVDSVKKPKSRSSLTPISKATPRSISKQHTQRSRRVDVTPQPRRRSPTVALARSVLEVGTSDSDSDGPIQARVLQRNQIQRRPATSPPARHRGSSTPVLKVPSSAKQPRPRAVAVTAAVALNDLDAYDIVVPPNLCKVHGECTIVVQMDAPGADSLRDLAGAVGAVGRLELDSERVMLDLKGTQYSGRIYPGPTALIVSVVAPKSNDIAPLRPWLKVEGMADEFCSVTKRGDSMSHHATVNDSDGDFDVNRTSAKHEDAVDEAKSRKRSKAQARPKRGKKSKR